MNICIFTRIDDSRLNFFLGCLEGNGLTVDLIVVTPPKSGKPSVRDYIKKILIKNKSGANVLEDVKYPIAMVEDHSSDQVRDLLLKNKMDLVFLSKAGIIGKNIVDGPWKIINCHPGILPRYRGKGSSEWAIHEKGPLGHYSMRNTIMWAHLLMVSPNYGK